MEAYNISMIQMDTRPPIPSTIEPRYLTIRTDKSRAIIRIQDRIMASIRRYFESREFCEVKPTIIGPVTDPGIRGAGTATIDYYGRRYVITTSMILYKQMLMPVIDTIYVFSPCVRLETERTDRHLAEFVQVDVEAVRYSCEEIMTLAEGLLQRVIRDVKTSCGYELETLDRDLPVPKRPFPRLTFNEAVDAARGLGFDLDHAEELPSDAEKALSARYEEPFWIVGYPVRSRGFYYMEDPCNRGTLRDFDLIFPEGFGEAVSGGEREYRHDVVAAKFAEFGLQTDDFRWYLDMLKAGVPPSAGFGIGLERLTRYVCGLNDICEATPFPRPPCTQSF